jgi:hypothetical protein
MKARTRRSLEGVGSFAKFQVDDTRQKGNPSSHWTLLRQCGALAHTPASCVAAAHRRIVHRKFIIMGRLHFTFELRSDKKRCIAPW